jgi:hypothetical protein
MEIAGGNGSESWPLAVVHLRVGLVVPESLSFYGLINS